MKITSGGQTGVDRGALDAAIALKLCYGGWVPKGGWAEDLPDPPGLLAKYSKMREAASRDPAIRTRWNVRDSEATLILVTERAEAASAGTRLTRETAKKLGRPLLIVPVDQPGAARLIGDWLSEHGGLKVVNIAGPRESEAPGIYALTRAVLETALAAFAGERR